MQDKHEDTDSDKKKLFQRFMQDKHVKYSESRYKGSECKGISALEF